jgi:hypothetical protein
MLFFFINGNSKVDPIDEPIPTRRLTEAGLTGLMMPARPEMSH